MTREHSNQSNAPEDGTAVSVCTDCEERWYYSRALCPACGAAETRRTPVGTGTLVATTTARITPEGVRTENPLGLASFPHDVNVLAQLTVEDAQRPVVGDEVRLVGDHRLRDGVEGPRIQVDDPKRTASGGSTTKKEADTNHGTGTGVSE